MNATRCILFAVGLFCACIAYAETEDPLGDFLSRRSGDVKDDDTLIMLPYPSLDHPLAYCLRTKVAALEVTIYIPVPVFFRKFKNISYTTTPTNIVYQNINAAKFIH